MGDGKINRDANGVIVGGTVIFDVNYVNDGPITFTGLHIHYPGAAGINAPVVINTGIAAGANSVAYLMVPGTTAIDTLPLNECHVLAASAGTHSAPMTNADINIHTTTFGGGVARSQMFPT